MSEKIDELIHGYFDGLLSPDQEAQLNSWIKQSPENASEFSYAASLENRMGDLIRAGRSLETGIESENETTKLPEKPRKGFRVVAVGWIGGLTTLAVAVSLLIWWGNPGPVNAAGELNRVIDASSKSTDRTYLIRNLDLLPETVNDRQPPIDGATLHVRQPDQYVLVRRFPEGRTFLTGSDGEQSWSIPPRGAVRVSTNTLRFRGPVPGNQHGVPFVNLRSDLVQMRDAYFFTLANPKANSLRKLMAEKKSKDYRGPNRIELWYDPETVVIQRMVFEGMPQTKGGPNSVSMELVGQEFLGPLFFRHESHHGKDVKVIEEDR